MDTQQLVQAAYLDNLRSHQIGGETDGITEDVAQDLGFETRAQTLAITEGITPEKARVALKASDIICGDCAQVIPCAHGGIRQDGTRYTKGY